MKRKGSLIYDPEQDRMDIRFSLDEYYGGLHCGQTLEVYLDGSWVPTRIEKGRSWYLVGILTDEIVGLIVRL